MLVLCRGMQGSDTSAHIHGRALGYPYPSCGGVSKQPPRKTARSTGARRRTCGRGSGPPSTPRSIYATRATRIATRTRWPGIGARTQTLSRSISLSDRDRQGARRRAKMSWQTYVDEHLMCEIEGHHLTSAAILGHDGAVWAQSAAFPQVIAIARAFPICSS